MTSPDSLEVLHRLHDGRFHSGEALSAALGISRAALWKRVRRLRELGVPIEALPRRGYRLPYPVEPLEAREIAAGLQGLGVAPSPEVEVRFAVPSTNTALMAELEPHPKALLAECQTGGRGRWGRRWISTYGGGIYLSVRWYFPELRMSPAGLSLAVAATVADAVDPGGAAVGLKWPNDLVTEAGKLGGMLVELAGEPTGPCHVVVGVGLNYRLPASVRSALDQPVVDLEHALPGGIAGRNRVAATLIAAVVEACSGFADHGLEPFVERWCRRDVLAGRAVRVSLADRVLDGTAAGLDASGALRIATADGTVACFSGDVELRVRR